LGAISKADAPGTQSGLIGGEVSGPVLGGVALPGVVDVEQAVHVGVRGLDLQPGQVAVPRGDHFFEGPLHLLCIPRAVDQGKSFLNTFILAQLCDQPDGLARLDGPQVMKQRSDVVPTQGFVVAEFLLLQTEWVCPSAVFVVPQESPAIRFKR